MSLMVSRTSLVLQFLAWRKWGKDRKGHLYSLRNCEGHAYTGILWNAQQVCTAIPSPVRGEASLIIRILTQNNREGVGSGKDIEDPRRSSKEKALSSDSTEARVPWKSITNPRETGSEYKGICVKKERNPMLSLSFIIWTGIGCLTFLLIFDRRRIFVCG